MEINQEVFCVFILRLAVGMFKIFFGFCGFQVCPYQKNGEKFNLQKMFPAPCHKFLLANPHTFILLYILTSASK